MPLIFYDGGEDSNLFRPVRDFNNTIYRLSVNWGVCVLVQNSDPPFLDLLSPLYILYIG